MSPPMYFLAAANAKNIPVEFWIRLGIAILVMMVVVILLRKLAKVNKVVLTIVIMLVLSIIGFNWIYERNEPAWATPVVSWLAEYFPTKGAMRPDPTTKVK